jgi:hypothetical protein
VRGGAFADCGGWQPKTGQLVSHTGDLLDLPETSTGSMPIWQTGACGSIRPSSHARKSLVAPEVKFA